MPGTIRLHGSATSPTVFRLSCIAVTILIASSSKSAPTTLIRVGATPADRLAKFAAGAKRSVFKGAELSRLWWDWIASPISADQEVYNDFLRLRARARDTGGYGVGLAISKALVEAYGGTITPESGPGRGTRMVVTIPLRT